MDSVEGVYSEIILAIMLTIIVILMAMNLKDGGRWRSVTVTHSASAFSGPSVTAASRVVET